MRSGSPGGGLVVCGIGSYSESEGIGSRGSAPVPGAVSPGSRPAFAVVSLEVQAVAVARSTGCFPVRLPHLLWGAVCRDPGGLRIMAEICSRAGVPAFGLRR